MNNPIGHDKKNIKNTKATTHTHTYNSFLFDPYLTKQKKVYYCKYKLGCLLFFFFNSLLFKQRRRRRNNLSFHISSCLWIIISTVKKFCLTFISFCVLLNNFYFLANLTRARPQSFSWKNIEVFSKKKINIYSYILFIYF